MNITIECKNIAGLLLQKDRLNVTMIHKVDLPQRNIYRHTIYVQEPEGVLLLQEFRSKDVRNSVYNSFVEQMRAGQRQLHISYLDGLKSISDDMAEWEVRKAGYNRKWLSIARSIAEDKIRQWNKGQNKYKFDYKLLLSDDLDICAYKHGWALKIPYQMESIGVNPFQFYKSILK